MLTPFARRIERAVWPADKRTRDDFADTVRFHFRFLADAGFSDLGLIFDDDPPTAVAHRFRARNRRLVITGLNYHRWSRLYFHCLSADRRSRRFNVERVFSHACRPSDPRDFVRLHHRLAVPTLAAMLQQAIPTLSPDDPNLPAYDNE